LVEQICFLGFSRQNHAESFRIFVKKTILTQNMQKSTKSRKSDMSGPASPGGQVLTANQRKYFIFSELTPFRFLLANLSFFIKSCV
jgi:hypothetical protein